MKRKHKKIIAVISAVLLTLAMGTTAFAGPLDNSTGGVNDTQSLDESALSGGAASKSTEVTVTKAGNFSVTIPKKITLPGTADSNGDHKTSYSISVKGDIGSNDQISVIPQSTVTLKQANKTDVTANVTQGAQIFRLETGTTESLDEDSHVQTVLFSNLNSESGFTKTNTGLVSAKNLSAGTWSGTYTYNIKLEEIPIPTANLLITGSDLSYITEMICYGPTGSISYSGSDFNEEIVCYPGYKIVFRHDGTRRWVHGGYMDRYRDMGVGEYCNVVIPDNATGTATLYIASVSTSEQKEIFSDGRSDGWIRNLIYGNSSDFNLGN